MMARAFLPMKWLGRKHGLKGGTKNQIFFMKS